MKLSILICTLDERKNVFEKLMSILSPQTTDEVEIVVDCDDRKKTIGQKRNDLLNRAVGDYIVFIDDDDSVPDYYVSETLKAVSLNPDVVGINGIVNFNGSNEKVFKHSIAYRGWYEENGIFYRCPNHWNPVKREYAIKTRFPEINYGEDWNYSIKLRPRLKTEVVIEKPMYYYNFSASGSIASKRHREDIAKGKVKQSQNGEDKVILDHFKGRIGTFLDIGAYDGETLSNTFALANSGWSGVCIEPSSVFGKLKSLYHDRQDIELFNVCIGTENGTVDFWDSNGDLSSTTNKKEVEKWEKSGLVFTKTQVPIITVSELVNRSQYKTFEFINIDVEDDELGLKILADIDTDLLGTKMICIEGNGDAKKEAYEMMWDKGFSVKAKTFENLILARPL